MNFCRSAGRVLVVCRFLLFFLVCLVRFGFERVLASFDRFSGGRVYDYASFRPSLSQILFCFKVKASRGNGLPRWKSSSSCSEPKRAAAGATAKLCQSGGCYRRPCGGSQPVRELTTSMSWTFQSFGRS